MQELELVANCLMDSQGLHVPDAEARKNVLDVWLQVVDYPWGTG